MQLAFKNWSNITAFDSTTVGEKSGLAPPPPRDDALVPLMILGDADDDDDDTPLSRSERKRDEMSSVRRSRILRKTLIV